MRIHCISHLLAAGCLAALLSACSGHDDAPQGPPPGSEQPPTTPVQQTPAQKIAALEASRQLPQLDRSAALAGTDANQNGVRDDVDAEIQAKLTDPAQRQAATQVAKAMQGAVTVTPTDASAVRAVSQQMNNAIHCLFSRVTAREGTLGAPALATFLEAITANTKPRLLAYLAYNKALDGTATSLPKGDTCE